MIRIQSNLNRPLNPTRRASLRIRANRKPSLISGPLVDIKVGDRIEIC